MSALFLCWGLLSITILLGRSIPALSASAVMWGAALLASAYLIPLIARGDVAKSFRAHMMAPSGIMFLACALYALIGSAR